MPFARISLSLYFHGWTIGQSLQKRKKTAKSKEFCSFFSFRAHWDLFVFNAPKGRRSAGAEVMPKRPGRVEAESLRHLNCPYAPTSLAAGRLWIIEIAPSAQRADCFSFKLMQPLRSNPGEPKLRRRPGGAWPPGLWGNLDSNDNCAYTEKLRDVSEHRRRNRHSTLSLTRRRRLSLNPAEPLHHGHGVARPLRSVDLQLI